MKKDMKEENKYILQEGYTKVRLVVSRDVIDFLNAIGDIDYDGYGEKTYCINGNLYHLIIN